MAVRLAFALLTHTQPAQVTRLIARLQESGPDTSIFVHHDASAIERLDPASLGDAVHLVPDPHRIAWGDGEDVLAMLDLMRTATTRAGWEHLVFLSGQDYPLRPLRELVEHLGSSGAQVHMDRKPVAGDTGWPRGEATARYAYRHVRVTALPHRARAGARALAMRVGHRPRPATASEPAGAVEPSVFAPLIGRLAIGDEVFVGVRRREALLRRLDLHCGSQWFAARRDAVERILAFHEENRDLWAYFRRTVLPDEAYFQTVAARLGLHGAPHLHVVEHDGPRARVVTRQDVPRLRSTGAFFCRKVDPQREPDAIDALDEATRATS
jgi:hypothetical protein